MGSQTNATLPAAWPPDTDTFAIARPVIQHFEGFVAKPYLCPAGKWTIGWGTTRYPDGRKVGPHDYPSGIESSYAGVLLVAAMRRVRESLEPCVTRVPTVHQAAALICLAYNIGVGAHDGVKGDLADSTLLARFNAGDIEGAANAFLQWDKAHVHGKLTALAGLKLRREKEREMFLTAD